MTTTSRGRTPRRNPRYVQEPSPPTSRRGTRGTRRRGTTTTGTTNRGTRRTGTTTAAPTTQSAVPGTQMRSNQRNADRSRARQQRLNNLRYPLVDRTMSGDEITKALEDLMENFGKNLNISGGLEGQGVNVPTNLTDIKELLKQIHLQIQTQNRSTPITLRTIIIFGMKAVQNAILEKYRELVEDVGGHFYDKLTDDQKQIRKDFFESQDFLNKLCEDYNFQELTIVIEGLFKTSYRKETLPGKKKRKSEVRKAVERGNPDPQCNKVIDTKTSPILVNGQSRCYLCSQTMVFPPQEIQCEHILPVLFAVSNLGLSDSSRSSLTPEALNILKYEYLWSHAACNMYAKNDIITVKIGDTDTRTHVWVPNEDNIKIIVDRIMTNSGEDGGGGRWQQISKMNTTQYNESIITILKISAKLCKILNDGEENWCKAFTDDAIIRRALCELLGKFKLLSALGNDINNLLAGYNKHDKYMSTIGGSDSPVGVDDVGFFEPAPPGNKDTTAKTIHKVKIFEPTKTHKKEKKSINQEYTIEKMWPTILNAFKEIKKGDLSLEKKDLSNIIEFGGELINNVDVDNVMDINKIDIDEIINYDENEDMDSILSKPKQDGGKYTKTKKNKKRKKSKKTRRKKSRR